MIAEIFLPEKIGARRILAQRIVGLCVQEDRVCATLVYAKRGSTHIESMHQQRIEPGDETTVNQRIADAIKKVMQGIKRYDQVRVAIPASIVTFKELQVPFIDPEKIRMVLDYEIEGMLPFALTDAVVDFIVTKEIKDQNASQLLVAAVRNQDLREMLDIYALAGVDPTNVTVDLFAVYGLYQQIPEYKTIQHGSALVDVGALSTRIAFLQNGELRLTRGIPRGLMTIARAIAEDTKNSVEQVMQKFELKGVASTGDDVFDKAVQKHFINFFNDIQFTLNSFSLKLNFYEGVNKVLFIGKTADIKGLMEFSNNTLQIASEMFDCKKIFENKAVKNKVKERVDSWVDYGVVLGTAVPAPQQADFDLRRKEFTLVRHGVVVKQLISACAIVIAMLTVIGIKGYLQVSALEHATKAAENQGINRLLRIFPKNKVPKRKTLQNLVREGEKLVKDQADVWGSFEQQRVRPLEVLMELTSIIDKTQNDVTMTELSIRARDENIKRQDVLTGMEYVSAETIRSIAEIDLDGYFKSKRGTGSHFTDWGALENRFKESPSFIITKDSINTLPAEDRGIKFSVKLKLKEK